MVPAWSVSDDRVQEALWRQGAHVYRRDVGFAEQTLDDRLELDVVCDDSVVFVVHRVVGAIGPQDARTGGQLLGQPACRGIALAPRGL